MRSAVGLREPLRAERLLLRFAVEGLREAELPLRFAEDGLRAAVLLLRFAAEAPVPARLPAIVPLPARFEAAAEEYPRAWLLVTRLEPALAPFLRATSELL